MIRKNVRGKTAPLKPGDFISSCHHPTPVSFPSQRLEVRNTGLQMDEHGEPSTEISAIFIHKATFA